MVVQTCPEPCVDNLVAKVVRHFEVAYGVHVANRSGGVETMDVEVEALCAKEAAEDLGHGRRDGTMGSGIFGVVWGGQKRPPAQLLGCRWVAIVIARNGTETVRRNRRRIDGGNWAPK